MSRPAIPAEISRAVLVEAGHRCAIPRCGATELDVHHIVPWETCQRHEYANLIALCPVCHRRAHKGDIDRKALFQYKAALTAGSTLQLGFEAPIVEIRRRISERVTAVPGYSFEFDFPDFPGPVQRVVSKNLEAWGNELLAQFRQRQEAYTPFERDECGEIEGPFTAPSELKGTYQVVRNDDIVISVEYTLDRFHTGAAHGGRCTRVQNFLIRPFQPVTLTDLISETACIGDLSSLIRRKLLSSGQYHDEEWVLRGTEPQEENLSRFVFENHAVRFIFDEYQIDCYAAGRQVIRIGYDQMRDIASPALLMKLQRNDLF